MLECRAEGQNVTREQVHVGPGVQTGTRDPVGAGVREGDRVGGVVFSDGVQVVKAIPSGGEPSLHTLRQSAPEVEANRGTALQLVLVVAHHEAAIVSRKMIQGVAIAERERGIGAPVKVKACATADDLVPKLIVDRVEAVARKA